jgi:hypothetical protein
MVGVWEAAVDADRIGASDELGRATGIVVSSSGIAASLEEEYVL